MTACWDFFLFFLPLFQKAPLAYSIVELIIEINSAIKYAADYYWKILMKITCIINKTDRRVGSLAIIPKIHNHKRNYPNYTFFSNDRNLTIAQSKNSYIRISGMNSKMFDKNKGQTGNPDRQVLAKNVHILNFVKPRFTI